MSVTPTFLITPTVIDEYGRGIAVIKNNIYIIRNPRLGAPNRVKIERIVTEKDVNLIFCVRVE